MASTFTTRLNLEKPGTGEQDGTWGTTLNSNLDTLDEALAGFLSKSVAGSSNVTLTAAEYLNPTIELTGTLTGNINVIMPALERTYDFINNTTGAFSVTIKTSGGTGIAAPQGGAARVTCDGTNVEQILTSSTTAINNVVEDTTPELGGVLDTNDRAINESEGSSVASSSSTNIWQTDGNTVHVTGTTTITSFATAPRVGAIRRVIVDGVLTLTDNSSLILPGDANITTAAGDAFIVYAETTSIARVLYFTKAAGAGATEAQQEAASSSDVFATPATQHFHPSAAKVWSKYDQISVAINASYNVSSITDHATGDYSIDINNVFSGIDYGIGGMTESNGLGNSRGGFMVNKASSSPPTASVLRIHNHAASTDTQPAIAFDIRSEIVCFGDLA